MNKKTKLESFLGKVAKIQYKHSSLIFSVVIIFTFLISFGIPNIRLETDLSKELPQDLPAIIQQNKVSDKLGGINTIFILVQLDKDSDLKNRVRDIRDPRVMRSLVELQNLLKEEPKIEEVQSPASIFKGIEIPQTLEGIRFILDKIPMKELFNKDYSATVVVISANIGSNEQKIKDFVSKIKKDIASVEKPPGVKFTITGNPPIRATLIDILKEDALFTLSIAIVIIFLLLIFIERSLTKALLIFSPLIFGLIWTFGTMGLVGIPLNVATVAIGAMIVGLGIEYGVFMLKKFVEEMEKGRKGKKALINAVPSIGSAILGSGTTTIIGFLALLASTMPMIQQLGITLALGIFYCLFSAIFISPILILILERKGRI